MKFNLYNIRKDVSLLLVLFFAFTVGLYSQPCPGVPSISSMVFSPADACTNGNHAIVNAVVAPTNPGSGYEYRYSLDGSPSFANSLPSGVPAGPHCITIAVFATTTVTCGGNTYNAGDMIPGTTNTYSIFFGSAGPPAFAASSIIGNLTCAATISVIPNPLYSCFTYEYSIDGGLWSSTIPGTLTRGCHTISYRLNSSSSGFFGCGTGSPTPASANTNFVLFDDLSAAPITLTTTCSDGTNGTISSVNNLPAAVPGLTVEYSVDGGPYSTTLPTNLIPGCHNLMIREMADCPNSTADGDAPTACRAVINFVIYPTAPVITAPANTCAVAFTLPSVPVVTGFDVEYSIDGGAWSSAPTTTTPGCHTVSARYVLASACGALPYNIIPAGTFSNGVSSTCIASSNVVNVVIFPAAPVIAAPANTCASAFTLPSVPAVTGFNVQWSIDGGAFTSTPVIPTTPGCHNVRAQYVLGAACGTTPAGATGSGACGISNRVNVVIFPQAPVITPPTNTCNAAFVLPVVAAVPGFSVEYSVDGGATFSTAPTVPSTAGCYSVAARYVLASDCGVAPENVIPANTPGTGVCGTSNIVSVVIFPTAPTLTEPAASCDAMFTLPAVPAVTGFTVEYELDGSGSWSANPSTTISGCHSVRARYVLAAACGSTPAGASSSDPGCAASAAVNALIYPEAPVITAPANTCTSAFTLPVVTPYAGFTVQYRIQNVPNSILIDWTSTPVMPTTPGCYTIQARYVNTAQCGSIAPLTPGTGSCGSSNVVNTVIFPAAPVISFNSGIPDADIQRCPGTGLLFIIFPPYPPGAFGNWYEFELQYRWNGVWSTPGTIVGGIPDWFAVGCKEIVTRYVLKSDCGSTLAGTSGETVAPACGLSNSIFLNNTPPPPVISATANTCGAMFALPTVPAVPGYTVEYSIDGGGTWSANPSTTTAGCYAVRARYVLAAACGSFPVGTPALAACQASNTVQITIFPAVTGTITSVNKSATCGNTDITLNWDVVPASPLVSGGATFEIQYSLDGGAYSATLPTGITPGCHTVEVRYALTAACGSTGAGTVSPGCGATRTFIVWPDLSTLRPSVTLSQNCAGPVNVTGVTLGTATPSIPAGMEFVYQGTNNGVAFGPVDIAGLTAMNFAFDGAAPSPGCHSIRATIRATTACGAAPDGAAAGDIMPVACRSLFRGFLSFPEPTAIEVDPVCTGGNLVVTPLTAAPTDHQWRYRLINNTTGTPVVGAWQASTTFVSPAVGCYTIEVTPVRLSTCFSISPVACSNGDPAAIFPSNHQNPLDNQNACDPATISAVCVNTAEAFVLPAPPMAITPNNITVCLGETGKIDLQYFEQMVPACLVDPVTGVGPATVSYVVTSSDPLVVVPGTINNLPNNQPELMWMGENGNNFPNVVTIGVTPQITLDGVTCQGAEVKFSITVQPNFAPTGGWEISPNTAVQCANNNGWTISTTANTADTCSYELYYNLSTSPIGAPIGNALVQTIAGNGAPVSFQPVFIPGTYQVWQRCNGCAELAVTFTVSIIDAPALTDILLETCPTTPGGNSGTFTGIIYTLPTVPAPQSIGVTGYYNSYNNALNGGTTGLISATAPFDYVSSDGVIFVRIGHDVDGITGYDCYYIGTIELRVVNRPIVTLTAIENPSCINQQVELTATVVAGSGGPYTYTWTRVSPAPGPVSGTTGSVTVTETTPGDYVYRLTLTDPNNNTNGTNGPVCETVADITVTYTGPIIICPANFTAATDAGSCNAYVNLIPAEIDAACADEFTLRYWVTGATTIASAAAPVTLSVIHATPMNTGVNTVHAIVGTETGGVFTALVPEVSCTYTATVIDFEEPIARCKDITLYLNASGTASIVATDVDGGSSDNCGVASLNICPGTEGFTGDFAPANWTFDNGGGTGTVDISGAPNTIEITGSNGGTLLPVQTTYCITVPSSGMISFSWDYETFDFDGPSFDPFLYSVNGTPYQLTFNGGADVQNGMTSVSVAANDQFCFVINSTDDQLGAAVTLTSMFSFDNPSGLCNFTCSEIGQNDVILLVTDVNGNASTCIANVTVVDNIAPTLVCPANITMNVTNGTVCTWTSGILAPTTLTDNCTATPALAYTILNPDQTIGSGTGSVNGYVFGKGTSVVTYTATDPSGNTSTCIFTVTVVDNIVPQFANCPQDITVSITNGGFTVSPATPAGGFVVSQPTTSQDCSVDISYTAPTASDNCPGFVTQLTQGVGGAVHNYSAGTHVESYLVTDASGNTATCSFTITVVDERDPVITCPADLTVGTDPSYGCTAYAALQPTVSDNCTSVGISHYYVNGTPAPSQLPDATAISPATAKAGFTSGLFYPGTNGVSGTTTVVFIATDLGGNTSTCSVNVTVADDDDPTLTCPVDITLNANANCNGVLSAPYAATYSDNCNNAGLTVTYVISGATTATSPATGQNSVPVSQLFNLGTSFVTFTATDANGNSTTCTSTVVVQDITAPVITCPTVQSVYYVPSTACVVTIPLVATATDNCSVASIHHNDPFFNAGGDATGNFGPGTYTIDFIATDGSGNTSLCTVSFEVRDTIVPSIACPANVSLNTGAGDTDCAAPYTWNHPAPTDNCSVSLYTYSLELPNGNIEGPYNLTGNLLGGGSLESTYNFPKGTTRVRYNVRDVNGNINTCYFDVVVTDNTVPVFVQCPSDFTATNSPDLCSSVVTWADPIASDNCGYVNVLRTDAGPAIGGVWPLGTYAIRYVVTDASNNTAACTFTVTVTDTQNPDIFCPSVTQTFPTDLNTCTWDSDGSGAVSPRFKFDNCPYNVTYTVTGATTANGNTDAEGTVFNLGTSTVTYTITEQNGQLIGTCSFDIVVEDRQAPAITCPAGSPFTFDANNNVCSYTVPGTALDAVATDNCTGGVTMVNNYNNGSSLSGAVFPVGTTTVIWTATDASGNKSSCTIVITVMDRQAPTVSCASIPTNPLVTEIYRCERQMSWQHPVPADNCGVTVYTYTITNPDGTVSGPHTLAQFINPGGDRNVAYDFEEGTSTLTYYVRDAAGNAGSCTLTITVVDKAMPFFTNCPSMIMVANDIDKCSAKVNWNIPYAVDNCDVPLTVVPSPNNPYTPGSIIPVGGPYTITYTATDTDGNTATCTFTILVIDTQQPEILAGKPQNVTVECDNVPKPLVLNPNDVEDNCTASPTISFNQTSTQSPNQALCLHYNYTLTNTWTVRDASNNAQVWTQVVTVKDTKAPQITVPIDVTVECKGGYVSKSFTCSGSSYAPTAGYAEYGVAAAVDNCAPSQFICIEFTETFAPGKCGYTGVITRTWTATDPCGNRSQGVQKITITDVTPPVFTCKDITVNLDENGKVSITAGDVIVGGINGATDLCSPASDLTFQISKFDFTCDDIGPNEVLVKVIDDCGNESACFATVTVKDVTAPTILCPQDQTFQLGSGECTYAWPGGLPAWDNCSVELSYDPSDLNFPIGKTLVTATATDKDGNTATCTFTVVVLENIPSNTLTCNNHVNLSLDTNCEAVITPDMILEGNNYRCFDNYCIEITTTGGLPHANYFDLSDKDKIFNVSIIDCNGTGSKCWGTVKIEEKLVPEINCPEDVTVTCNTDVNERYIITLPDGTQVPGDLKTGEAYLKTCKPGAVITYKDWFDDRGQCSSPRAVITRTWTATYGKSETVSCDQTITIMNLNLDDIVWPEDFTGDNALECMDVNQDGSLTLASHTGYPTLNGVAVNRTGNLCMVSLNVSDEIYDICPGSYEILRTWKVRNMCLPISSDNPLVHTQVIKVGDTRGPKLVECPADITISVDPWECYASAYLPVPAVMLDGCSKVASFTAKVYGNGKTTVTGGILDHDTNDIKVWVEDLGKGIHLVEYTVMDECGNITRCYFNVNVVDATAPVAIAKQDIVLSLTGGNSSGDGIAKLFAWQVDNNSYDQCSAVRLELRRIGDKVASCQNIGKDGKYNNNLSYNDHNGLTSATPGVSWLHPDDNVNDSDGGNYVKFCCEDIPQGEEFGIHQVELRVWDDGNMNGIVGDNLIVNGVKDNYNTTWADIRVENKIPPQIVCAPDVTVTCDMEINLSIGVDTWIDTVDLTMTGYPKSIGVCNSAKITYKDAGSLDDCNRGTITRTFTATIGSRTSVCTQKITVGYIQVPFTVTFPSEGQLSQWEKCSFDLTDARNSNDPKIKKPIVNYGQCDIVGESIRIDTFLFEDGACKKWKVSYTYKNWCTGEEKGPYVYYYAFKDEIAPELVCADKVFPATPPSPQNPLGGCEGSVVLTSTASDALVCAEESWIKWQVFFDGWSNGTVDRLGSSFVNKAWKDRWEKVDRFINGAPNPVWTALQAQHPGVILADPVYVTYIKPTKASGDEVKLPAFTLPAENIEHKVLWKITDGCGNVDQCNSTVKVVDQKAPTPYCVHISTAIMQTNPKMVELWAKDFDKGAFDNCTPQNKLYFTFDEIYPVFSKLNQEHYFKAKAGQKEGVDATLTEYNQGKAQKWIPSLRSSGKIWTTAGVTNIKVSVWDESWNTDFCEVELKIIDNGPGSRASISGTIATASGEGVSNATVTMDAPVIEYPKSVNTDINGNYITNDNPLTLNYTVNASKGGDYVNGVTTLDIVIIQRHILGMESLNDNYKVIAADANNDSRITAQDLSELRKLILGVTNRFGNESWRFPVAGAVVNTSPIAYSEEIQIDGLSGDVFGQNFVAVKIGDVNGSVDLSAQGSSVEARSNDKVRLSIAEANVAAGELVTIPVTASNFVNVSGFQYTMHLNGASFVSIEKGALDMSTANVGNLGNGVVTMSYAGSEGVTLNEGEVLFTMVVRGDKASKVSEIFSLTSAVTKAESYNSDLKVGAINLEVRTAPVASIELYQNEPNPFKGQTTVSFMMPEAGAATLSVYDMTGKLVVTRSISAVKGLNSEVFTKDQLGVSGVMYYTLESGDFTATKKMIIVE